MSRINLPIKSIANSYRRGRSIRFLSQLYNVSEPTIINRLKEAKAIKPRPKLPKEEIIKLYKAGIPLKKIGQKYGVAGSSISIKLEKWSVRKRRRIIKVLPPRCKHCGRTLKTYTSRSEKLCGVCSPIFTRPSTTKRAIQKRQEQLLRLLVRLEKPIKIGLAHEKLKQLGYDFSYKTFQRDIMKLAMKGNISTKHVYGKGNSTLIQTVNT